MLDRTVAPVWGKIEEAKFPSALKSLNDIGIPIYHIKAGEQPVIKIELILESGIWHEPIKSISWFTAKMLAEGTATKSAKQISESFEALGAFLEITPGFDDISIAVHGLKKNFDQVLILLSEILNESIFPANELETLKSIRKDQITLNNQKSNLFASKKLRECLYGSIYPYGQILETEDVENITQESVLSFYKNGLFNNAEIFLSGQVEEELLKQVKQLLHIPKCQISLDSAIEPNSDQREIYVERVDSLQSSVRLAWCIPNKKEDDYFSYLIANNLLGGYFGSRLMKNIREEKGYTYGVSAYPVHLKNSSFGMIASDVKAKHTQDTINEIHMEINRLIHDPIGKEEIETVTNYMAGAFLSSINTPFQLMEKFKNTHSLGLDEKYYQRYFHALNSITEQDIKSAMAKYFRVSEAYQVIVGLNKV
jgi:predicted Zn-dependent peptidase